MPIMTNDRLGVTAGIDTHRDVHVAVTIDSTTGRRGEVETFSTDPLGLEKLERWLAEQGPVDAVGIEGTGAYGAGIARHLTAAGHRVVEVDRPDRQTRRRHGKSDPVDAEAAARSVLAGTATGTPKSRDGLVEAIRPLVVVQRSAVKDRTRAVNQFKNLLVTAPTTFRVTFDGLDLSGQLSRARNLRDVEGRTPVLAQLRWSLRELARRIHNLDDQIEQVVNRLTPLVVEAAPALLGEIGFGIVTTAQLLVTVGDNPQRIISEGAFARICGVAPIPASSGNRSRHRLDRGGDRHANSAIHHVVLVRESCDPETRAFIARATADGRRTARDARRSLKRYVARRAYRLLTNPPGELPPTGPELRRLRTQAGLTLTAVADHLGWWPAKLSELERQKHFNTDHARAAHQAILALDRA